MKKLYIVFFILLSYNMSAQLVLNETLFDPAGDLTGDANGDGVRDAAADEFIEFVNNSASPLDISGYKIYDATNFALLPGTDSPNHLIPASTTIPANGIYVVFGGGAPVAIPGALIQTSSSGNLNLNNGGDVITVVNNLGNVVLTFDSAAMGLNMGLDQSAVRNINIIGNYDLHGNVNGKLFSPGVLAAANPLMINEVLYDPAGTAVGDLSGDANGDGSRSSSADEFIEFYNNSTSDLNISGFTVSDASSIRHTFANPTIIPANKFLVLFGGGTPTGTFGGSMVRTASTSDLNLTNSADVITIRNNLGEVVLIFDSSAYTNLNFGSDQSVTRSPDFTGNFVLHTTANASLLFSPGVTVSGTTLSTTNNFSKDELAIFPNPTNTGSITIHSKISGEKNITLFDVTGRQVLKTTLTSNILDVSAFKSGLYMLNVSINNRSSTTKLLIK